MIFPGNTVLSIQTCLTTNKYLQSRSALTILKIRILSNFPSHLSLSAIHPLCHVFHHLPPLCRRSRHALGALGTARRPQPPAEERVARPPAAEGAHRVETGHFKGHQGVEVRGMQHLRSLWETPKKMFFPGKKIHSPHRIFSTPSNVAVFLSCVCSSGHVLLLYGSNFCWVWEIAFLISKTCNGSLAHAVLPKVLNIPCPKFLRHSIFSKLIVTIATPT